MLNTETTADRHAMLRRHHRDLLARLRRQRRDLEAHQDVCPDDRFDRALERVEREINLLEWSNK